MKRKDDVIKIINAFMKAGTNLDTDVFPKMLHKNLYMEKEK